MYSSIYILSLFFAWCILVFIYYLSSLADVFYNLVLPVYFTTSSDKLCSSCATSRVPLTCSGSSGNPILAGSWLGTFYDNPVLATSWLSVSLGKSFSGYTLFFLASSGNHDLVTSWISATTKCFLVYSCPGSASPCTTRYRYNPGECCVPDCGLLCPNSLIHLAYNLSLYSTVSQLAYPSRLQPALVLDCVPTRL